MMTTTVFLAVILAAILHASWNALVKAGTDKKIRMAALVFGHLPLALLVLPFVPYPAIESWGYILVGAVLHFGYQIFLMHSYRVGDLTQVYPIARGLAPLLVAVISVAFLDFELQRIEIIAIIIIALGIISLSFGKYDEDRMNHTAICLAVITGCFIASYSLIDGTGARLAGTALGFYGWLAICNAVIMLIYLGLTKSENTFSKLYSNKRVMFLGGSASFAAYGLVIWAFTQAPIPLVTALRETSIVFALIIGVFFMNERLNIMKIIATFLTLLGVALLRLAKH